MADENTPNTSASSQSDRDSSQPRRQGQQSLPSGSSLRHPHASITPSVVRDEELPGGSEQVQQPPPPPAYEHHGRHLTCPLCNAVAVNRCNLTALEELLGMTEASLVRYSGFIPDAQGRDPDDYYIYGPFLESREEELMRLAEGLRHVVEDLRLRHRPAPHGRDRAGFRGRCRGRVRRGVTRLIGRSIGR